MQQRWYNIQSGAMERPFWSWSSRLFPNEGTKLMEEDDEEAFLHTRDSIVFSDSHGDTLLQKKKMDSMESLDYRTPFNKPLIKFHSTRTMKHNLLRLAAKWTIYLVVGIMLGCIAFGLRKSVDYLTVLKLFYVEKYMQMNLTFYSFLVYFLFNVLYALLATVICLLCGPLSAGSGIPEVKGFLNGVQVDGTINIKTCLGKLISTLFSFSSCLPVGPEGPMVHIGAILGGGLSSGKSRTLGFRFKTFDRLRTPKEQRDFISSGAAGGLAAAFGAPIGGVIFALEETSSFWSRELTWRTLFGESFHTLGVTVAGCMVAALTVAFSSTLMNGDLSKHMNSYGLLSFGLAKSTNYRVYELLAFSVVGALGGVLGAAFVRTNLIINQWRRDNIKKNSKYQLLEVLVVTTICAALTFFIPFVFPCRPLSDIKEYSDVCDTIQANSTQPTSLFCSNDQYYNGATNLFIIPSEGTLRLLFSRTKNIFTWDVLLTHFTVYSLMAVITAGLNLAAGLFIPMMLIGASGGRMFGQLVSAMFSDLNPPIDVSIYSLVGAASMITGFSRITISICVIIVELTENTQYLFPIVISVMCAKWVGDVLSKPQYEAASDLQSIPFLEHHPPDATYTLTVSDIMTRNVKCIDINASVADAIQLLKENKHNGFPVVAEDTGRGKIFRGFILRKQLLILIHTKQYTSVGNSQPPIMSWETLLAMMNQKWSLLNIRLPPLDQQDILRLNIADYMDRSHHIVPTTFSFIEAYNMFQRNELRHLSVIDSQYQVAGIITRHDLLFFHFQEGRSLSSQM